MPRWLLVDEGKMPNSWLAPFSPSGGPRPSCQAVAVPAASPWMARERGQGLCSERGLPPGSQGRAPVCRGPPSGGLLVLCSFCVRQDGTAMRSCTLVLHWFAGAAVTGCHSPGPSPTAIVGSWSGGASGSGPSEAVTASSYGCCPVHTPLPSPPFLQEQLGQGPD